MLINPTTISNLQKSFSLIYEGTYSETPEWGTQVATTIPSSTKSSVYGWMERIPVMREWLGTREINNLTAQSYTLENKKFEDTIAVKRDDIEDDNLGVYSMWFKGLAFAAKKWPDIQLKTALQAGATTGLGFDGLSMFNDAHLLSGTGQDNNFTSTALTQANYAAVRAAMMNFVGKDGQPLGVTPNLLVVPPQLESTARLILNGDFIVTTAGDGAQTNQWKGSASLLVVPELANLATTWYLMDTTKPVKPLVWQLRKAPALVMKTNPMDDNVFFQDTFLAGIDSRGAAGYGPWFLAARAIA